MRHFHTKRRVAGLLVVLAAGCAGNAASPPGPPPAPPPPEVVVAPPVVKEVADYEDTTGRIGAIKTVEVRARVTGYLQKINFTEGTEVKAGDVLFEIDPRPYEAELARAEATVGQSQARLRRLTADLQRAIALRPTNAIGREEYDKIAGDRNEAEAGVKVATAARDLAALNVEYTKVKAPIDGLVGRHFIDVGNLVKADETALTTIVTQDPMYAWFDVDERTLLRLRRMQSAGQLPASPAAARMKVLVGLADEEGRTRGRSTSWTTSSTAPPARCTSAPWCPTHAAC
jgi:RND family efflux transporter MFP subunit